MELKDIKLERINGTEEEMSDYLGNLLLIVNTASKCGFTPQYKELEEIYEKYHEKGFQILAFPCNQFKEQEPGGREEIESFCQKNYGVTFPLFAKTEVKGSGTHPLFRYLTEKKPFEGFDKNHPLTPKLHEIISAETPDYEKTNDIKWNFTKFLLNREGTIIQRFEPTTDMEVIEKAIDDLVRAEET